MFGTGSNAAYVEQASRVKHWEGKGRGSAKKVCIDIEWGAFGDKGSLDFIRTVYDDQLDQTSLLPGAYTYNKSFYAIDCVTKKPENMLQRDLIWYFSFEKYIGGKYLGELVRLVLSDLHAGNLALASTPKEKFPEPWSFDTSNISDIEE